MKISLNKLKNFNLLFLITLTVFILNRDLADYCCIIYFMVAIFCYTLKNKINEMKISSYVFLGIMISGIIIFFSILCNNYGYTNLIITFAFTVFGFFEFNNYNENTNDKTKKIDFFYWIILIWLIFFISYSYLKGILGTYDFYLPSTWDKNYSGVVIYLFFCYCLKNRYKLGMLISFIYVMLLGSRLSIISIALVFLIRIILHLIRKNEKINCIIKKFSSLKTFGIASMIFIMTVVIVLLSYYAVKYIPIESISGYKESINDKSNAIRLRANVYAVEKLKEDKMFIIRGYDNKIKTALGVETELKAVTYMGFRLVQPHNFLLNLLLRYGMIFTIIYLLLVSKILSRFWNRDNLAYIIPYLIMNMFMHSLLTTTYLMCFMFILTVPNKRRREITENED